jgi:peptide/nickel transport system permease protein
MRTVAKHGARILIVLLLGGFLGATLVRFAPGFGVDEQELDSRLSRASMERLRQEKSVQEGLGSFYVHYLAGMLRGDLGMSRTLQQPVSRLLAERVPATCKSVALGLLFGWTLGFSFALLAVFSRSWCVDLLANLVAGALLCIPAAVLAILFVIAQAPSRLVLGLIVFPKVFRYSRNLLGRAASLPHVLMARAKGLSGARILLWHVLPVTAPRLLALAGISVSVAFAAAIPVEVLCDLPGIGQLAWKAALGRDLELLVNLTMIVTVITLLANSASDLLPQPHRAGAA